MGMTKFKPKDLGFIFIKFKALFGLFPGSELSFWCTRTTNSSPSVGIVGRYIIRVNVSVESVERERRDVEEREGES